MNNLTWEQFFHNVQTWAKERRIYDHSTPTDQLLKTMSELGGVADAVIKSDHEALADGIGDVAVCLVNYVQMIDKYDLFQDVSGITFNQLPTNRIIGMISSLIGEALEGKDDQYYTLAMICALRGICQQENIDFMACCTSAWEGIKE